MRAAMIRAPQKPPGFCRGEGESGARSHAPGSQKAVHAEDVLWTLGFWRAGAFTAYLVGPRN